MLNKDIELLEGLVLVWGNDYLKTKKEESKTKYIDNFTKLINIYEQIYLEEINKLKDTNNNIVEEEKRLIKLKELKEKRIAQKEKMSISYKNITSVDYIFEPKTDEPDLDSIRNRLEVIQKYLNNTKKLEELRKENVDYNQKLLDINEGLISNETKNISLEDELSEFFEQNFAIPFDNEEGYKERDNLIEIYDERIDLIEQLLKCSLEDELKQNKDNELSKIKFENFNLKNQLMLFDIKKLLSNKFRTYLDLKNKRDDILKLLSKRDELIKAYEFQVYSDDYKEFTNLIDNQINALEPQKEAITQKEKIEQKLKSNITQIEKLEKNNEEEDIMQIRKEFNLVSDDKITILPIDEEKEEDVKEEFDLDKFIESNKKQKEQAKEETTESLEEDLLKEEQNLEQILKELDIKLDQVSSTPKVEKKESIPKKTKEEIPNIEDVINELKKQYPTNLPKETEEEPKTNYNKPIVETKETKNEIEQPKTNIGDKFHSALDSITNEVDENEKEEDSFVFTPEDDNSLLSILSNNDSSNLDFLNGEALDNILNNNIYKNDEEE
ncbi:MAG: hypothetical protein ACI4VR_03615 [Bacilli bacterium]